jgi:hypothetical protein
MNSNLITWKKFDVEQPKEDGMLFLCYNAESGLFSGNTYFYDEAEYAYCFKSIEGCFYLEDNAELKNNFTHWIYLDELRP